MYKAIGGCLFLVVLFIGWLVDAQLSPIDKFNVAFPPSAEIRVKFEDIQTLDAMDDVSLKGLKKAYSSKLSLRALTCMQDISISRFDSIKFIKELPVKRECLKAQDEILEEFVSIKGIAILFSKPPLRPIVDIQSTSPIYGPDGMEPYSAIASSKSGVAVLQSSRSELVSIEIPSGKKIAGLPTLPEANSTDIVLSPNGRISAIRISNRELTFVDNETGQILWHGAGFNKLLAWLPELSAALVKTSKSDLVSIIDFEKGKIEPYPLPLRSQSWAVNLSESPSRVLIGSDRDFSLVENVRTAQGWEANIVKSYRITKGSGITSSPPTLMQDKKSMVFITSRDFMLFNFESGSETLWETGDLMSNQYGKLNEQTLLVQTYTGGVGAKSWVFNIVNSTLSPVKDDQAKTGIISELNSRDGFFRREYQKIWIGKKLEVGEPESLTAMINARNLEKQLAKLVAEENSMQPGNNVSYRNQSTFGIPAPEAAPDPARVMPAQGQPEFERKRREVFQKMGAQYSAQGARLGVLPNNVEVHALGVYQGCNKRSQQHKCPVYVNIKRSNRPIVLMLSSYEPVRWMIGQESGAKVLAIIVSGYYLSEVYGVGSARLEITKGSYAYEINSPGYNQLNLDAILWAGKNISRFQGAYEGASFVINQN